MEIYLAEMNLQRRGLLLGILRLRAVRSAVRFNPALSSVIGKNFAVKANRNDLERNKQEVQISRSRQQLLEHARAFATERPAAEAPEKFPRRGRIPEVDEAGFQIPIEDSSRYSDEEKAKRKKMAGYYSLLIAGLIGSVSSSYLLFWRLANVEAKEDSTTNELLAEEKNHVEKSKENQEDDNVVHKSKAGFRERKVRHCRSPIVHFKFHIFKS